MFFFLKLHIVWLQKRSAGKIVWGPGKVLECNGVGTWVVKEVRQSRGHGLWASYSHARVHVTKLYNLGNHGLVIALALYCHSSDHLYDKTSTVGILAAWSRSWPCQQLPSSLQTARTTSVQSGLAHVIVHSPWLIYCRHKSYHCNTGAR